MLGMAVRVIDYATFDESVALGVVFELGLKHPEISISEDLRQPLLGVHERGGGPSRD